MFFLASISVVGSSAIASAEYYPLEEIIVTSQKRVESLQDVPISVWTVSGDKIADAGLQRVEDVASYVPNFSVTKEAIGDNISIRGIASGTNAGFEQSVGTFVDGVYRGRGIQGRNAFMDVAILEVLRGPQGTLFGKNAVAGALNIRSRKPTAEFESEIAATFNPELEETDLQVFISGPFSDTLRGRLVVMNRERDKGWIHNDGYDEDGPNIDENAARMTLEWSAAESTLITFRYEEANFSQRGPMYAIQHANVGLTAMGATANAAHINMNASVAANGGILNPVMDFGTAHAIEGDNQESSVTLDTDIAGGTLTAIAAYSQYEFERSLDPDYRTLDLLRFDDNEKFEQSTLEVRFASGTGDELDYIVGLYHHQQDLQVEQIGYFNIVLPSGLGRYMALNQETDGWAAFGQTTWNIQDDIRLTLGLRYTEESKAAGQLGYGTEMGSKVESTAVGLGTIASTLQTINFIDSHTYTKDDLGMSRDEESLTWSVNLQHDLDEDVMIYANASTGFKAGGFNTFYAGDSDVSGSHNSNDVDFEEEEVITFELGSKMSLLGGAAELNLALFRTEYDDLQVSVFNGDVNFNVGNAAKAISQGLEIDGRWRATEKLTVSGAVAWIDFEYDDFSHQACTNDQLAPFAAPPSTSGSSACAAAGTNDMSGKTSANTPENSATLSLNYVEQFGDYELSSTVDALYADDQYRQADLDPISLQEDHVKFNTSVTFGPQNGQWDVSLIGKNLTDEDTFSTSQDAPLNPGAYVYIPDAPRTFVVRGRLRF